MRIHKYAYFTIVMALLCSGILVYGQGVEQLKSSDKEVREQALDNVVGRGTIMFGPLFQRVGSDNVIENKYAKRAIKQIVFPATSPNREVLRQDVESGLIQILHGYFLAEQKEYAIEMLSFVGREKAAKALANFLEDKELREMARWSLERNPTSAATKVLVDAVHGETEPVWAAALIKTLGQRGDIDGRGPVLTGMLHPNDDIRLTSIAAAGRIIHPKTERAVMSVVKDDEGKDKMIAANSALLIAEGWMDQGKEKRAKDIYQWFYENEMNPHLKSAGLAGLARLMGEGAVDELLNSLKSDSPRMLGVAKNYLQSLPGEKITRKLIDELKNTPINQRAGMISLIAEREGETVQDATPLLLESVGAGNDEVQKAAVNALIQIPGESTTKAILKVLDSASDDEKSMFLDILGQRGDPDALPVVYEYAQGEIPALRVAAIDAIAKMGDQKASEIIRDALADPNNQVREAAAGAVVRVAVALEKAGERQEAIDLLIAAAKATSDSSKLRSIGEQLSAMGETEFLASMAKKKGYIVNWFIAGPVPSEANLDERDYVDPSSVDVSQPMKLNGKSLDWKFVQITDPNGHVELDKQVANQGNIGAYLYAEVKCDKEQKAVLHIGSDDSFYCWLNGEKTGEYVGSRAWSPNQNQSDVTLDQGTNSILLLIVNGGGEWGTSLQITDTNNNALVLDQKKK